MTVYLIYLAIINLLTYILYAIDKRRARQGKYRIKEFHLLVLSLIGGAFGGYFSMLHNHHKTRKWYFVLINIFGIITYVYIGYLIYQL